MRVREVRLSIGSFSLKRVGRKGRREFAVNFSMEGTTDEVPNGNGGQGSIAQVPYGLVVSPSPLSTHISRMYNDENLKSLCDLILVVEDKELHTHRAVLASASPVFQLMFTNGMKETNPSCYPQRIKLGEVSYKCCENLLRFLYCGETLLLDGPSTAQLLQCAHKYQFDDLVEAIIKLLIANMTTQNILDLYNCSKFYNLEALENSCLTWLEKRFEEVHTELDYAQCPKPLMDKLLRSEKIEVVSEVSMLSAVLRWIELNGEEGRKEASYMLRFVRIERMSPLELVEAADAAAVSGMCPSYSVLLVEELQKIRASDSLSRLNVSDRSFLMRCRRKEIPFTFAQCFFGVKRRVMNLFLNLNYGDVIKGKWITDPGQLFSLQARLFITRLDEGVFLRVSLRVCPSGDFSRDTVLLIPFRLYVVNMVGVVTEICPRTNGKFGKDPASGHFLIQTRNISWAKVSKSLDLDTSDFLTIGGNVVLPQCSPA